MATDIPPQPIHHTRQKTIDKYVGRKYRHWTVLAYSHKPTLARPYFICRCDCGTVRPVVLWDVVYERSISCGCWQHDKPRGNRLPNGEAALNALFGKYKGAATRDGRIFNLTRGEFQVLISQNCFYCGTSPSLEFRNIGYGRVKTGKTGKTYNSGSIICNGIDRVDNELGYTSKNCVTCCRPCNVLKGAIPKQMVYKLYHQLFKQETTD